ncbi:hypothetical protein LCGC14_0468900 [marine sediment metagenome]|uniref:Uncharacterized protein n=1 Tax=marine sediment metagenome TaxID=412755 RepID=A0A0F9SI24_9ZZZZ
MTFTSEEALQVGEEIGIDWDEVDFDPEDLADGMDVELEHGSARDERVNITGDDPATTAKIAWAHLMESPDYYDALAEMEDRLNVEAAEAEERTAAFRPAYQAPEKQIKPGQWKTQDPQMSEELENIVFQYTDQLEAAIAGGLSANDAFKQITPSLENLETDDLVNLLYENQHVGGRGSLQRFKDWLPALDIFDLVQKLLERHIWEAAIQWWSTRKTELQDMGAEQQAKQKADEEDQKGTAVGKGKQRKPETRDDAPTAVLPKEGSFTYRGHLYREQA